MATIIHQYAISTRRKHRSIHLRGCASCVHATCPHPPGWRWRPALSANRRSAAVFKLALNSVFFSFRDFLRGLLFSPFGSCSNVVAEALPSELSAAAGFSVVLELPNCMGILILIWVRHVVSRRQVADHRSAAAAARSLSRGGV
jgi:hypothetical protein